MTTFSMLLGFLSFAALSHTNNRKMTAPINEHKDWARWRDAEAESLWSHVSLSGLLASVLKHSCREGWKIRY